MRQYFLPVVSVVAIASFVMVACANKPSLPKYPISDAQEVLDAFTEIDASTSVGVNFSKYTDKVIAVKTALEKYKATGKAKPEALPLFEKALDGYIVAANYWKCDIKYSSITDKFACQDKEFEKLLSVYPSITKNKDVKAVIEAHKVKGDSSFITMGFDQQGLLTLIWVNAKIPIIDAHKAFLEDVKE
jgi:hypothetical protein